MALFFKPEAQPNIQPFDAAEPVDRGVDKKESKHGNFKIQFMFKRPELSLVLKRERDHLDKALITLMNIYMLMKKTGS